MKKSTRVLWYWIAGSTAAAVGIALLLKKSDAKAEGGKAGCPTLTEIDAWGNAEQLAIIAVTNASEMRSPDEIWIMYLNRTGAVPGPAPALTREQFFDRFAYFVTSTCEFYTAFDDPNRFQVDAGAMDDFRDWKSKH